MKKISITCFMFALCILFANKIQIVQASDTKNANSWRYENGQLKESEKSQKARKIASAWAMVNGQYVNDLGNSIPNAVAKGIDVSHNNGVIDWNQVKTDGIDFAILRCGYGSDDVKQDDTTWEYNSSQCEALGIPYGTYLYSYATDTKKAKSEAQHVIRLLQGKNLSYPIYYDLEDNSIGNLSASQLGANAKAFVETLNQAGYYNIGIYANKEWFTKKLTNLIFLQRSRWVAQYSSVCNYNGSYHMWQATASGSVAGVTGNVDVNFKIGNWASTSAPIRTIRKPAKTKITSLKKKKSKNVLIKWKKVAGVSRYEVYMSRKKKSGYKRIKTTTARSYTKTKLKKKKRYYFKVRSYKVVDGVKIYSDFSKVKSVRR